MVQTDSRSREPTVEQLSAEARRTLAPAVGGEREAAAMVRILWEWLKGWEPTQVLLYADRTVTDYVADKMREAVRRIVVGEPIQQVTGEARFRGLTLKVTPQVLIPRPETAELVDLIVERNSGRADLRVLDLATGSGCIAVALALNLPFSHVTGVDISGEALGVARENAARYKVSVDYRVADLLAASPLPVDGEWDIIVSNPPYIARSEEATMERRVVDYEPASALFVPDDDPLCFYRAIGRESLARIAGGGSLYFEINPRYAKELCEMLEGQGWNNVTILRDSFGKERFAVCNK